MNSEKYKYDFLRYNKYHVLRPNVLLLLALAFLCKDIVLIMVVGAGSFKGGAGPGMSNLASLISPKMIVSDLPVIAVVFSLIFRRPEAGRLVRFFWKHGRLLIALSIVIYILLVLEQRDFQFLRLGLLEMALIGADLLIAAYVFSSRLVKDIFAEFPT